MVTTQHTKEEIFDLLSAIPDPEIPVINIQELGVLRDVEFVDGTWVVTITPTYSGCPAMKVIEDDIVSLLNEKGIKNIKINMVYSPAWTTDWMSAEARGKLRKYGIAPPEKKAVACPRCGSKNAAMKSQFGSTACKALYQCRDCLEPFDYFKCI